LTILVITAILVIVAMLLILAILAILAILPVLAILVILRYLQVSQIAAFIHLFIWMHEYTIAITIGVSIMMHRSCFKKIIAS